MRNKIGTLALTILMVSVGLAAIAPSAEASFPWSCAPVVELDDNHAPADEWTRHNHPRFTFPSYCNELATEVKPSWSSLFTTNDDDWHYSYLLSGEYNIHVRVLYRYYVDEGYYHCHEPHYLGGYYCWPSPTSWHWHPNLVWYEGWTDWVTSPTVKIDLVRPEVEIAAISGPFVQGPDGDYVTNETEIMLSASDAHSGVDRIEYRIDDGDWQVYNGTATVTGDDGEHTFTYRAIDHVGQETVKARNFIVDNNASAQKMIRPGPNSATYGDYAVETCNGAIRVTEAGEELFAAPAHQEAVDNATAEVGNHTPAIPGSHDIVNGGPDACAGQVVETNALSVVMPNDELDPVLDEIGAHHDQVVQAADEAREGLPNQTIEAVLSALPDEHPEAPDNVTVDGQDVDHDPLYLVSGTVELELDVQDEWVGTANVSFLVDGELQETQSNGDGVYLFQWDTGEVPVGRHEVTLRATDRLGNQDEVTLSTVVIFATPEASDPEVPEPPELPA